MPVLRRRRAVALLASLAAPGGAAAAAAPLRLVVAYPPGGVSDAVARSLASALEPLLGAPVRVENRAGAGGALALRLLTRIEPDGRTLVFSAITPLAFDAALRRGGPAAPTLAVRPVAGVMTTPSLLVATPAFQGARFADLLRIARARPGALRWATTGVGTTGHLVLEQLVACFGLQVTHVPYKGGGQPLTDALAGAFDLLGTNVGPLQMAYLRSGRLTALGIGAAVRSPLLADVPNFAELGCARADLGSLFGVFAAPATAASRVEALNAAIASALRSPAFSRALAASGSLAVSGDAAAFARRVEEDVAVLMPLLARATSHS